MSTSSVHCHPFETRTNCSRQLLVQFPQAPQPTYIHPHHNKPLAPIRVCEWQPRSPAAPDSVVAASVPREPPAGGRSIEGTLIITNHLPGREPWHIFITVVIKAIADYHQDVKLTRHLEKADYSTWWDSEWMKSRRRNFGRRSVFHSNLLFGTFAWKITQTISQWQNSFRIVLYQWMD